MNKTLILAVVGALALAASACNDAPNRGSSDGQPNPPRDQGDQAEQVQL